MSAPLRFAIFGAGFWAPYQLSAWRELEGVECVAVCDPDEGKAEAFAKRFDLQAYTDPVRLLEQEAIDFVEVISSPATHEELVLLAARFGKPVICQKPMTLNLEVARNLVAVCREAGVPFFVHENWRWHAPLRAFKNALEKAPIGEVFRARIQYSNSFPVFDNQPSLRQDERFMLLDMGTHILDVARALFGEAASLYCRTSRVNPVIKGEDVATVMLGMTSGATVTCEMSYASILEQDRFPETFVFVEGSRGSASLDPDYWVRVTTSEGTTARRHVPHVYPWAHPRYGLAHSSCVPCNADILSALRGEGSAETTGEDNVKTLELVFASYDSAATNQVVPLENDE